MHSSRQPAEPEVPHPVFHRLSGTRWDQPGSCGKSAVAIACRRRPAVTMEDAFQLLGVKPSSVRHQKRCSTSWRRRRLRHRSLRHSLPTRARPGLSTREPWTRASSAASIGERPGLRWAASSRLAYRIGRGGYAEHLVCDRHRPRIVRALHEHRRRPIVDPKSPGRIERTTGRRR